MIDLDAIETLRGASAVLPKGRDPLRFIRYELQRRHDDGGWLVVEVKSPAADSPGDDCEESLLADVFEIEDAVTILRALGDARVAIFERQGAECVYVSSALSAAEEATVLRREDPQAYNKALASQEPTARRQHGIGRSWSFIPRP